jgi:hypothetical protein
MKYRADTLESHPHPASGALADLGAKHLDQRLDLAPSDVRGHRVLEDSGIESVAGAGSYHDDSRPPFHI